MPKKEKPTLSELATFAKEKINSYNQEYWELRYSLGRKKIPTYDPTNIELAEFSGLTRQRISAAKKQDSYTYKTWLLKWKIKNLM